MADLKRCALVSSNVYFKYAAPNRNKASPAATMIARKTAANVFAKVIVLRGWGKQILGAESRAYQTKIRPKSANLRNQKKLFCVWIFHDGPGRKPRLKGSAQFLLWGVVMVVRLRVT